MTEAVTVASLSAEVAAMRPAWDLVDTLLGGTAAMQAAGRAYLPKFAKETDAAYKARLEASVLFPAYKRTVSTLGAKPFSREVVLKEDAVPKELVAMLADADLQGRNLHAFASDAFAVAMGYGLGGILVEYPVVPEAVGMSEADDAARGLRPYLVLIKPRQILGWRARVVNGQWRIDQLRLMERVTEQDGPYGERQIEQVRVLMPDRWETHRQAQGQQAGKWVLHEEGINTLGMVPFVPIYGERCGFMQGRPPLLELAHLNVAHWRSDSDQRNILHVARVPILAAIGVDEAYELTVGAQSATKLPQGAELKYVEHSGAAIEAGAKDLADLEERMRQSGAELLVLAPGKVTASQVLTENAVGMCVLQEMAERFEDALDAVLAIMVKWLPPRVKLLGDAGWITLYKDFGAATLAEASAQLLLTAANAGKISDETLHAEFRRRGILAPDTSWDMERERLASQGPPV